MSGPERLDDAEQIAAAVEDFMQEHARHHQISNSPYGHVCDRDDRIAALTVVLRRELAQRVARAVAEAKVDALREAADEAERDAESCPEGCNSLDCRLANLTTARWLRARADREAQR